MEQPEQYDTVIWEKGIMLSGGQRQRLALARIFLSDAEILLLDEPTNAIDQYGENLIRDAMQEIGRETTIIHYKKFFWKFHSRFDTMASLRLGYVADRQEVLLTESEKDLEMIAERSLQVKKSVVRSIELSIDEKNRILCESRQKFERDYQARKHSAIAAIAKTRLATRISIDTIVTATNVTHEVIGR